MNRRIKIYHPMMWMVMHDFILVTALFLRANFKADEEETLGATRPPDLRQGPEDPGPATGDITLSG